MSHEFCRTLLAVVRRELSADQRKKLRGAWSYMYPGGHGEFHVPSDGFYWYGSADCAWHARASGIQAWLDSRYPEQKAAEDELCPSSSESWPATSTEP